MTLAFLVRFFSLSPQYPSRYACIRNNPWMNGLLRECLAETLGTFIFMLCGHMGTAAFTIGGSRTVGGQEFGGFMNQALAWSFGLMLGVYCSGGVSGAHLNPAVTLALAVHRGFEKYKAVPYMIAQFVGALLAAALSYTVYFDAVAAFEDVGQKDFYTDKSAGIWVCGPSGYLTVRGAIIDNIVGTAGLLLGLMAISDARNFNPVAANLAPLVIALLLFTLILGTGMNAGAAINPVRDFPQRVFLSVAGWGTGIFSRHENWWWIPVVCPFLGAQLGVITYDLAVGVHHDQASVPLADAAAVKLDDQALEVHNEAGGQLQHSSSYASDGHYTEQQRVNIHAVGGLAAVGYSEPTGMVHVNEAFLDPKIKASADKLFHKSRVAKEKAQQDARARSPMQMREPLLQNP